MTSRSDNVEASFRGRERLWRALFAFTRDRQIAEDALAEAYAQVLRRGTAVSDVDAWVWSAAFKIASAELKDRGRWAGSELPEVAADLPSADDAISVLNALSTLSNKQRASLLLTYYADFPAAEVARILETSPQAVRVHLFRARRKLSAILEAS